MFVFGYLVIGLLVVAGCCYLRYCSCVRFDCALLMVYLWFGCGFGLLVWWIVISVFGLLLFSELLSVSLACLFLVLLMRVWGLQTVVCGFCLRSWCGFYAGLVVWLIVLVWLQGVCSCWLLVVGFAVVLCLLVVVVILCWWLWTLMLLAVGVRYAGGLALVF